HWRQGNARVAPGAAVMLRGVVAVMSLAARQEREDVDVSVATPANPGEQVMLDIQLTPESAVILLDGKPVQAGRHRVAPGHHTVVARGDGFREESEAFEVKARQTIPVNLTLEPQ